MPGRMVECGECGSLIPQTSKRCPKCGAEFELGMAKCSHCGARVPVTAKGCPRCGIVFGLRERETYEERTKKEYKKYVDQYRRVAKKKMGKKYNEKMFQKWWKRQPTYLTFKVWLKMEEEKKRKKKGTIPCPSCGTLNPIDVRFCRVCHTSLEKVKKKREKRCIKCGARIAIDTKTCDICGALQEEHFAPVAIKKPIGKVRMVEKKIVKKKVVKKPKPEEEGEEKEEEKEKEMVEETTEIEKEEEGEEE